MTDCIFCKIARGEIKTKFLYEDEHLVAFRDLHPQAPVHILLIPRAHANSILDLNGDHAGIMDAVVTATKSIVHTLGCAERGFRLVTNVGPDGGQSVHHLHFHLLAGRLLGWPPG